MRVHFLVPIAGFAVFLASCNDARKPGDANFAEAINHYLAEHGSACTLVSRPFLIDIPVSAKQAQYGFGPQLTALLHAGLVSETDTAAVVHRMLDAVRGGPGPAQPVKRYQLTAEGWKYFHQATGTLGQAAGLCYGQQVVDSVVKWTEPPAGPQTQAEVTYTYKLINLAAWAERPDIQQAFPDIRNTVNGASKANQVVGLQLTNEGWEIPGS